MCNTNKGRVQTRDVCNDTSGDLVLGPVSRSGGLCSPRLHQVYSLRSEELQVELVCRTAVQCDTVDMFK